MSKVTPKKKSLIALLFTSNASLFDPALDSEKDLCRWLKGWRYQRKLCQRRRGLPELLQQTRQLSIYQCQQQFRFEQWNCSTIFMKKFFKKLYRETAFMYSLAASAFVHVVAQACIDGKLANCKCLPIEHSDKTINNEIDWKSCSVDTQYASRFVGKFLQLKTIGDNPNNVMKYNIQVGLKVARSKTKTICICHGVSGTCNFKTCIKRLVPFHKVAESLKKLYHNAIQVESNNNIRTIHKYHVKKQLIFLDQSPNFCDSHKHWGFSTAGRQCRDPDNCATLCCSNDYTSKKSKKFEQCKCQWRNDTPYNVACDMCPSEEIEYYCST